MTRKHFQAVADILKDAASLNTEQRDELARDFARLFQSENPRFDGSRFQRACQPEGRTEQ